MKRGFLLIICLIALTGMLSVNANADKANRTISVAEYQDKMKAGWVGQMAGVGWGAPTEFQWLGSIIPEEKVPKWTPDMINQYQQDDIYVEMTFMQTLEKYGLDASIRQAGIDFANSGYDLWHANKFGRENLRKGIAPPDSGHPKFTAHADDIDYQIEADYAGLIAPGMPQVAIELGEKFGRLMNYGDGLYGGQFIGGMYAEAFFETDMVKIVEAGLKCIPAESLYAQTIRDLLQWYKENPTDWQKTWNLIEDKYQKNIENRKASCSNPKEKFNIDAKINGAYIVLGLLYGKRDIEKTITIAMRGGQDSDCNPSSAGGILFTTIGFKNLPKEYVSALDETKFFSHTPYTVAKLIKVCEDLVRQAVKKYGGKIEKDKDGKEIFEIPASELKLKKLEQCWNPGPIANSLFTKEEMAQIKVAPAADINKALKSLAPGWKCKDCGEDMEPGLKNDALGKKNVLLTHPLNQNTPCILSRLLEIPKDKKTNLLLTVGHHPQGDWELLVKADGKEIHKETIGGSEAWKDVSVDLSAYSGKKVNLELLNSPTGWSFEGGYWAKIEIVSQ